MSIPVPPTLDPILHQPVRSRLALLLHIAEPSFSQLKKALAITDGNLDAHLKKLSASGYLHSRMVLDGRPHTVYRLSTSGTEAFETYLNALDEMQSLATHKIDPSQKP